MASSNSVLQLVKVIIFLLCSIRSIHGNRYGYHSQYRTARHCGTEEIVCPDGSCVPSTPAKCYVVNGRQSGCTPADYEYDQLCSSSLSTNYSWTAGDGGGGGPPLGSDTQWEPGTDDDDGCDPVGSVTLDPSPLTGDCHCKALVRGERCSQCTPGAFHLTSGAADGCIPCWCSELTQDCQPGLDWYRDAVMLDHSTAHTSLTLTNIARSQVINQDIQIDLLNRQVVYRHFRLQPDYVYYWNLPPEFLANKVASYGGNLYFTAKVDYSEMPNSNPLAVLLGPNGLELIFEHDITANPFPTGVTQSVSLPLYEQHWKEARSHGGQIIGPASRSSLMRVLAHLEGILLKATPSWDTHESALLDVTLDTALSAARVPPTAPLSYVTRAGSVEVCRCPVGYDGTSCETCAASYSRSQAGHFLGGVCVPCYCNGHSSQCDPHTGVCHNCLHNTSGDFCQHCLQGFTGDATRGTPQDCRPVPYGILHCNCGLGRCRLTNDESATECVCPFGRTGPRCEVDMAIEEPSFGGNSFAVYPRMVGVLMSTQIRLKFKTYDPDRDQLLVYAAQAYNGSGDFISLTIHNRSVEFRFDTGSGYAVMTSRTKLRRDEWVDVIASREQTLGALLINEEELIRGSARGRNIGLNLGTQLFVGGADHTRIVVSSKVGLGGGGSWAGLVGCISSLEVNTRPVDLIHSVVDSENVVNCDAFRSCGDLPCKNGGQCQPAPPPTTAAAAVLLQPPPGSQVTSYRSVAPYQHHSGYVCICRPGFMGRNCEVEEGVCEFSVPCQNGGTCQLSENGVDFTCYCQAGWSGPTCSEWVGIPSGMSLAFTGNSLVCIDRTALPHLVDQEEIISLVLTTSERHGLVYYQGQEVDRNGRGHDFVALVLEEGLVKYLFELGSGTGEILHPTPVDDGLPHRIMFRRMGNFGSLEVDDIYISGQSDGNLVQLNTQGDIFLGGLPNMRLMTGNRFRHWFRGCITNLNIGNNRRVNMINGTADIRIKETRNILDCS